MNQCAFPNCRHTATKNSTYCATHDMRAMCAIMEALDIEHPEPVLPPACMHRGIMTALKAREGHS